MLQFLELIPFIKFTLVMINIYIFCLIFLRHNFNIYLKEDKEIIKYKKYGRYYQK